MFGGFFLLVHTVLKLEMLRKKKDCYCILHETRRCLKFSQAVYFIMLWSTSTEQRGALMKFGASFEISYWYTCYHKPNLTETVVLSCASESLNYYQQLMKILLQLPQHIYTFWRLRWHHDFPKIHLMCYSKKPEQTNKWPWFLQWTKIFKTSHQYIPHKSKNA